MKSLGSKFGFNPDPDSQEERTNRTRKNRSERAPIRPTRFLRWSSPLIMLGVIILGISLIRVRLLSFPLERDEGEYAYFAQLILQGIPPYSMAYNLKLPGTYYSYALIMAAFGQSSEGIHLGLLLLSVGSMLLVFVISKRLFNEFVGLAATAVFGLVSISPTLLGQAAHANHFVTFYMLAGFHMMLLATEKGRLTYSFAAGIFMGLAFLSKQPGLFFCMFGALIPLLVFYGAREDKWKRAVSSLCVYGVGLALPVALVILTMRLAGVFDRFWFWTVMYPQIYGSRIPVAGAWRVFKASFFPVASVFTALWIMAGLGVAGLFFYPGKAKSRTVAALFLLFSILSVIPGFHFRQHYFLPLAPALGLMAGIFLDTINQRVRNRFRYISPLTALIFLFAVITGLYGMREFFFKEDPAELCRNLYAGNPFAESVPIASYVRQNTEENDRIFVFGSEPQICFYSRRKSATGYIYMYDLAYNHQYLKRMQSEMVREVEASKPKMIVYVSTPSSWLAQGDAVSPLSGWLQGYLRQNRYVPVCYADILFPNPTVYAWGDEAKTYQRKSDNCVVVFKREEE